MSFSIASLRTCGQTNAPLNKIDWGTFSADILAVASLSIAAGLILGGVLPGMGTVGDPLAWVFVASGGVITLADLIVLSIRVANKKTIKPPPPGQKPQQLPPPPPIKNPKPPQITPPPPRQSAPPPPPPKVKTPPSKPAPRRPSGNVTKEQMNSVALRTIQGMGSQGKTFANKKAFDRAVKKSCVLAKFLVKRAPERANAIRDKVKNTALRKGERLTTGELGNKTSLKIFKLAFKTYTILAVDKAACERVPSPLETPFAATVTHWPNGKVQPWTKLFNTPVYAKQSQGNKRYYACTKQLGEGGFNIAKLTFEILAGQTAVYRQLKLDRPTLEENLIRKRDWLIENQWHQYLESILGDLVPRLIEVSDLTNGVFTQYCDEGSLFDAAQGKSGAELKVILLDVLRALETMHENGIVHGDFKVANILVHKGRGKIADFGGTYSVNNPTFFPGGCYQFRAPEAMLFGGQPGVEIDMWAFGLMAFWLKYGCFPSFAEKQNQMYVNAGAYYNDQYYQYYIEPVVKAGIDELKGKLNPHDPYDQLIKRCLRMNPNRRLKASKARQALKKIDPAFIR